MKTDRRELAAEFLLGKLNQKEQEEIEREFFHDPNLFEHILIAENNLIDAYVSDNLSPEDRAQFEKRLLINPKQRQRVKFARALIGYASNLPAEDTDSPARPVSKWSSLLAQLFSARPLLSYSAAAAAFIFLIGAALILNSSLRQESSDGLASTGGQAAAEVQKPAVVPQPEAVKPAGDANNINKTAEEKTRPAETGAKSDQNQPSSPRKTAQREKPASIISTIILPLGATRDVERAKAFDIPAKANLVNLQLELEADSFASYYAVLETVEGEQLWRGKIFQSGKNKKAVTFNLPARLLKKGDYIVSLKGLTKDGTYEPVSDYSFTINQR